MSLNYKLYKRANASSWARSQLRSRHLSSNDFNRRRGVAMSITVSISAVQTHTPDVDTEENVEQSPFTVVDIDLCGRRPNHLDVESPTDLFVASHWLERSFRFPVTLLVFSRVDHSTLQVLTTFYVVLSQLFTEGLL